MMTTDDYDLLLAYADLRAIVIRAVRSFSNRYRTDLDETRSEADLSFVLAHKDFDRSKCDEFAPYFLLRFHYRMKTLQREKIKESQQEVLPLLIDVASKATSAFALDEFLDMLSDDARIVVKMALHTRQEIEQLLRQRKGQPTPKKIRGAIRDALKSRGWKANRIIKSFREIREALRT